MQPESSRLGKCLHWASCSWCHLLQEAPTWDLPSAKGVDALPVGARSEAACQLCMLGRLARSLLLHEFQVLHIESV